MTDEEIIVNAFVHEATAIVNKSSESDSDHDHDSDRDSDRNHDSDRDDGLTVRGACVNEPALEDAHAAVLMPSRSFDEACRALLEQTDDSEGDGQCEIAPLVW